MLQITKLVDGDFFGEMAMLAEDSKRSSTVIAIDICEIYCLEYKDFKATVLTNPEANELVKAVANERLNRILMEEEKHLMDHV